MRNSSRRKRRRATWVGLGLALVIATTADAAPKKAGFYDRFWADWEGFDHEAYVMMQQMGPRFGKMEKAASIARDSGDTSDLNQSMRDQLTSEVVDWAADLNPAIKPITTMSDFAMNGTRRWLDWSFRREVNQMYLKYKAEFAKTGNVKRAADAVSQMLDDASATASLGMKESQFTALRNNRALVIAAIINNHKMFNPDKYEGKDVARELRDGRDATPPKEPSKPLIPKPASATNPQPTVNTTPKPTNLNPPAPNSGTLTQPVTPGIRQSVLDCMCRCNSTAQGSVGVRYDPAACGASPHCAEPGNGACVNQGIGCWRHKPPSGGDCVNRCYSRHNVAAGSVVP